MKKIVYFLSAVCLLLLSCEKEHNQNRLWLSHTEIEFSYQFESQEVIIVADGEWKFLLDAHWISAIAFIYDPVGEGLMISARPNNSPSDRSTKVIISLSGTDIRKEITISQKGDSNAHSAYATVTGYKTDWCGFLIQFDEDAVGLPFPFEHNNGLYGVINLPERHKNEGERINVTFRPLRDNEWVPCPAGKRPEFLYIVRVNSVDGIYSGILTVESYANASWRYVSDTVTIKLYNGRFHSTGSSSGVFTGGTGDFSVISDNRIRFNDDRVWAGGPPLILEGEYYFEFEGNRLRIFKEICNSPWLTVHYEYVLEKQ
jgi:hypothetical protein